MSERAVSKVTLNGTTLIDVTQDTVAANNLLVGKTATGADGKQVVGSYSGDSEWTSGIYQDALGYIHVSPNGGAAGFTLTDNHLVACI